MLRPSPGNGTLANISDGLHVLLCFVYSYMWYKYEYLVLGANPVADFCFGWCSSFSAMLEFCNLLEPPGEVHEGIKLCRCW
jgi:hypothetical protein